jgi:hypothetical protein
MSFTAPTKEAIVKPKYDATYKFKSDDKQKTVTAEKAVVLFFSAVTVFCLSSDLNLYVASYLGLTIASLENDSNR